MKNRKWCLLLVIFLLILGTLYFFYSPSTFDEKTCDDLSEKGVNCTEVLFIDNNNKLLFFKNEKSIRYAEIDDDLNIVEIGETFLQLNELTESNNEPLSWMASDRLLWGLASEDVQSILITGDNNIQPNKVRIEGIWFWYQTYEGEVKLPVLINAYDKEHALIYGKE